MLKSNKGFTLSEILLCLLTAMVMISMSFPLLQLLEGKDYSTEHAVFPFFHYVQRELNESVGSSVSIHTLSVQTHDGKNVTFEKRGNEIIRRVNGQGYEYVLRNVEDVKISEVAYGIRIQIWMESGKQFSKTLYIQGT